MKTLLLKPNDRMVAEENQTDYRCGAAKVLPYSIAACAAQLRKEGQDVQILDTAAEELLPQECIMRVEQIRPDIIVIPVNVKAVDLALEGMAHLKRRLQCSVVILCSFPAFIPEIMRKHPYVDIAIGREWIWTLSDLVKSLSGNLPLSNVEGIVFRQDEEIIQAKPRPHININHMPIPAFDLLSMERYDSYHILYSEGCCHHCSFCPFGRYPPSGWEAKEIDRIIEEIRIMLSYGNKPIGFIDNEITLDVKRAKELCRRIIDENIRLSWHGNTRASIVDEELFYLMARAGCKSLGIGVESGNQEVLDLNRKDLKLEDAVKTVNLLNKYNIRVKTYFLIGLLGDTVETVKDTFRFATETLTAEASSFDIAIPYPETYMYEYLKEQGWIEELTSDNLVWIYKNVYDWEHLQRLSGIKPDWRVGELTFDHLVRLNKQYYPLVQKRKLVRSYKHLLSTDPLFISRAIKGALLHPNRAIRTMRDIFR